MTAITSISAASAAAAYRVDPAPAVRRDPMVAVADTPRPDSGGVNSGLKDPDKLDRVSEMLNLPAGEVEARAGRASDLVTMLQNRGLDLGQLRNVMSSGDLLDVRA
jgi:hypothetical protein